MKQKDFSFVKDLSIDGCLSSFFATSDYYFFGTDGEVLVTDRDFKERKRVPTYSFVSHIELIKKNVVVFGGCHPNDLNGKIQMLDLRRLSIIQINTSNVCHIPLLSFIYKTSVPNEIAINGFRGFRFLKITNDRISKLSLTPEQYYPNVLIDAVVEICPS